MLRLSAIAVAVLGTAVNAWAQTPATNQTAGAAGQMAGRPATDSPYWTGQSQQPVSDLPAADIRAVPVAHANYVRANGTFQQSLFDLNNAVRLVRMQMDRDPGYVKAKADEKAAYDELEKARSNAMASLANDNAYSAAAKLHANLTEQIQEEQWKVKPDATKLAAMAKLKLDYVKENRRLERDALDRDSAFQDARRKYAEAHARVTDYDNAQDIAVAQNDTLAGLRKQVALSRIEKTAASVFWTDSIYAGRVALDYAEYSRGIDRYHGFGNGYSPYGYGNGYGYGFPY